MYGRSVGRIMLLSVVVIAIASLMMVPLIAQTDSPPCDECPTEMPPRDLETKTSEEELALRGGDVGVNAIVYWFCELWPAYKSGNTVRAYAETESHFVPGAFIQVIVEVTLWKRYYDNWAGGYYWVKMAHAENYCNCGWWNCKASATAILDYLPPSMLSGYYYTSSVHQIYTGGQPAGYKELETNMVYLDFS